MKNTLILKKFYKLTLISGIVLTSIVGQAHAQYTHKAPSIFDMNKDNVITVEEVSQTLFNTFDADRNRALEDFEYNNTIKINLRDFPQDDYTYEFDNKTYSYTQFTELTQINLFDDYNNGLKGQDLLNESFFQLDKNENGYITFEEWHDAYLNAVGLF